MTRERRLSLGPLRVEVWVERPPESWKRFESGVSIRVYDQ